MIYSVFVGKYSSSSESKNDLKKLNAIGMKGYLFIKGDFYSLKVYSTLNSDEALQWMLPPTSADSNTYCPTCCLGTS